MRGKYAQDDIASIQALVDQTTLEERGRLAQKSFVELWRTLWNGPASRRYHAEFEQAKTKLELLRSSGKLDEFIKTSITTWKEAEWGFPKGRRSSVETELACALRETYEEAGIPSNQLKVHDTVLIEELYGSNGIRYRHKYWMALAPPTLEVRLDPTNQDQMREIGAVRWCTYEEAIALIRPYNVEKLDVLGKARGLV
jgi:8-oxo-dGTP pyrophosphatase MutT (NUDIX family)